MRLGPLLIALGLCGCFCGAGMGYVWHRNRNEQLARLILRQTARLEQLRAANQIFERQLDELRSPRALEAAVHRWNLGLVMPQPEQILRIPDGKPEAAVLSPQILRLAARQTKPLPGRPGETKN